MGFQHPHEIIDFCHDIFVGMKHTREEAGEDVLCDDASYFIFGVAYARVILERVPGSNKPKETFEMFYEKYREYDNQACRAGMTLGKHLFLTAVPQ